MVNPLEGPTLTDYVNIRERTNIPVMSFRGLSNKDSPLNCVIYFLLDGKVALSKSAGFMSNASAMLYKTNVCHSTCSLFCSPTVEKKRSLRDSHPQAFSSGKALIMSLISMMLESR
jgi:hypothetical protein